MSAVGIFHILATASLAVWDLVSRVLGTVGFHTGFHIEFLSTSRLKQRSIWDEEAH